MGRNIFVISDTHFGHKNFLNFTNENGEKIRNFSSVEEMDEIMVENWNKKVRDEDIIYHLGDVYFGDGHQVLPRLRGRKRLIAGNHDNLKSEHLQKHFQKIMLWRMFPDLNCVMTHIPLHESNLYKVKYNVHGHIHQQKSPDERYINACVEHWNYSPIAIEEMFETYRIIFT